MLEVITRRYKRVITDNLIKPNLIIVDGGEPQVKAANLALKEIGVDIPLIGLVKDDRHKTSGIITKDLKEIKIDKKSNLFLLLEAMQDEVHRFAITFFRKTASNNMLQSSLEKIDGIGKNRRLKLLSTFDNIEEIKAASIQKLKSLGIPEDICIKLKNEL
jgi:excinuclease ABC subunit C